MAYKWIPVFLLLIYTRVSIQKSTPESKYYRAAVVEYSPKYTTNDGPATLNANADMYLEYIKDAGGQDVDIIVFPECGLTSLPGLDTSELDNWATVLPSSSDNYVPCTQTTIPVIEPVKKLSCAARDNGIYVVVNLAEKSSKEEKVYYNTMVAFDRDGKVVGRYRKIHLYEEDGFISPKNPEIVTFDTDFNQTFGMMICFDILFRKPGLDMVRQGGVRNIVYSTAWFSELPFLTAIQTQAGWAYAEDVNFLAAGYNNPSGANTGSGIYLGCRGTATAILARSKLNRMLIHDVPKIPRHNEKRDCTGSTNSLSFTDKEATVAHEGKNDLQLWKDRLDVLKTVDVIGESFTANVCDNDFCCQFDIKRDQDAGTMYKAAAFAGTRLYGTAVKAGVNVCALIQCKNESVLSCATAENSETVFSRIQITGKFDNYQDNLIFPSTLNSSLLPIQQISLESHRHDDHIHVNLVLTGPTKNLATFAFYGRDFQKDSSATSNYVPLFIILGALFAFRFL